MVQWVEGSSVRCLGRSFAGGCEVLRAISGDAIAPWVETFMPQARCVERVDRPYSATKIGHIADLDRVLIEL